MQDNANKAATLAFASPPKLAEVSLGEWLLTNGLGGYASSTFCGMNTRRYHGLLVAPLTPPTQRCVVCSTIEEVLMTAEGPVAISTHQYPGAIDPSGYHHLRSFARKPWPCTHFEAGGHKLSRTVAMPYGHNTTLLRYANTGETPLTLRLAPLYAGRDYHALGGAYHLDFSNVSWQAPVGTLNGLPFGQPVYFWCIGAQWTPGPLWYHKAEYRVEMNRGQDFQEDVFSAGHFTLELAPGQHAVLGLSLEEPGADLPAFPAEPADAEWMPQGITHRFVHDLVATGQQFVVQRHSTNSHTIIAGYHWFSDWGRDTMIALRGLAISLKKDTLTQRFITTFISHLSEGMIPNRFPDDASAPMYNTVDATLWLFVALYEHYRNAQDLDFVKECFPALGQIIAAHVAGTRFGIHVTEEGLLYAGDEHTQLTWMDAYVQGLAVTPRFGCPVEVNLLWYNALKVYALFAKELGEPLGEVPGLLERFEAHFMPNFWNSKGYLNDVVIPGRIVDERIRCNQIFAVSLPFSPVPKAAQGAVFQCVQQQLYTPYGLRTLSPDDPDFVPDYTGDRWQRDHAYHQGTVWPFLLGEFFDAYFNLNGTTPETRQWAEEQLQPLMHHFYHNRGTHCISEIFDGLAPEDGRGCIQQAWSISALIKVIADYGLFDTAIVRS